MYTIKQAALRSGLPIATVRAWERRYEVVRPERTPSGYRLYDDAAVDRLVAMRHLVEVEGIRPSQAADQVRSGGAALTELIDRARHPDLPSRPEAVGGESAARAVLDIRDAARRLDIQAIDRLLDEAFAAERFEAATTNVVYPALRAIGEEWAAGTIDVAMEHAASEAIRRRVGRFYDAVADLSSPFDVLVGLPPGCQHEIGAMGFAVAARRRGLGVLYLGANVPVESWVRTSNAIGVAVTVVGAIGAADVPAATEVVTALLRSANRPVIAVGGRAGPGIAAATGVIALPDALDAAVEMTRELVRAGR